MQDLNELLRLSNTLTAKLKNQYPALSGDSAQIADMIQRMIGVDEPVSTEPTEADKPMQIEPTVKKTEVKPDRK